MARGVNMAARSGFSSAAEIAEGMGLQLSPRQRDAPALSTIVDHGGHLVLVRRGERAPVWSKWQKRKPALDLVEEKTRNGI